MTADEWVGGANKPAKMMDMETLFKGAKAAEPAKRSSRLGAARSTEPKETPKSETKATSGQSL